MTQERHDTRQCFRTEAGVELFASPWVTGTRAGGYYGIIAAERFVSYQTLQDAVLEAEEEALLDMLGSQAASMGCNAVVGIELEADPFAPNNHVFLRAVGTAARLEPLL